MGRLDGALFDKPYHANTYAYALDNVILLYVLWGASRSVVDNVAEHPWLHLVVSTTIQCSLGREDHGRSWCP